MSARQNGPVTYEIRSIAVGTGRLVTSHRAGRDVLPEMMVFHGTPGCGVVVELAGAAADDLGVGIVCVNRPGYAGSGTAAPGFDVAVEDALAAADGLGMGQFAVLGVSGGGPFAAAVAAAAADRVTAVGIAAGIGDWREVEAGRESWDPVDVQALDLAEAGDVKGAEALLLASCHAHFDPLLASDDESLAGTFLPPSENTSPALTALYVKEFRESLATYDGLIYDNLTLDLPWSWKPTEVYQPAWLWYGEDDRRVPARDGEWYENTLPDARLLVWPGERHGSVAYGHWHQMFETLRSAIGNAQFRR